MQIVLVGQPELADLLDSFDLRQLRQRINLSCKLSPLTLSETREYILHRTTIASGTDTAFFSSGAIRKIYRASKGIPRKINIVCDRSLLAAYASDNLTVTTKIAKSAIKELEFPEPAQFKKNKPFIKHLTPLAVGLLTIIIVVFISFNQNVVNRLPDFRIPEKSEHTATTTQTTRSSQKQQSKRSPDIAPHTAEGSIVSDRTTETIQPSEFQTIEVNKVANGTDRSTAVFYLFSLWKKLPEKDIQSFSLPLASEEDFFRMAAVQNRFLLLQLQHDFDLIEKMDFPAILELAAPKDQKPSYIILHRITSDGRYIFSNGRFSESYIIDKNELLKSLGKNMYIACPNIFGQNHLIASGTDRLSIMQVKMILRQLGFTAITLDPDYDEAVEQAVKQVQLKFGLVQDGLVGPATKLALYKEKNDPSTPFLTSDTFIQIKKDLLP